MSIPFAKEASSLIEPLFAHSENRNVTRIIPFLESGPFAVAVFLTWYNSSKHELSEVSFHSSVICLDTYKDYPIYTLLLPKGSIENF